MRATLMERSVLGRRCVVRLDPSWFGRVVLRQKPTHVELEWSRGLLTEDGRDLGWWATGSGQPLSRLKHAALIERALDFQPVEDPPVAVVREKVTR